MCSAFLACGSVAGFLGSVALIHGSVVNSKNYVGYYDYGSSYGTFTFNTTLHGEAEFKRHWVEVCLCFFHLSLLDYFKVVNRHLQTPAPCSQEHLSPEARQSQSLLLL